MGTHVAAAIYCRISSDREGLGLGVERQETLCRELAQRKGWTVTEVYVDNDLSAYSGKRRPAYEQMLQDMRDGQRDAVVVVDTDRLTRHPRELEEFIEVADRHGVALANVAGEMDLASSDGRFRARIMGAVARQESEKKSERLRRQREQAALAGRPHKTARPFGYEPDSVTPREPEASMVREGAAAILAGRSLGAIATEWNERGITTARGNKWTRNAVSLLFKQPRIAGLRVHRGEVIGKGQWEPLIDDVTWERLSAKFRTQRKAGRPPKHLLTGTLRCGLCSHPMLASGTKPRGTNMDRRIYACQSGPGRNACGRLSINRRQADEEIRDQVFSVVAHDGLNKAVASAAESGGDAQRLTRQLERDKEMLEELSRDYYVNGRIGRTEFYASRQELEDRIVATGRQLERLTVAVPAITADDEGAREWWDAAPTDARRRLVEILVDRIVVHPQDPTRPRVFDPERLEVIWRV